VHEDRGADGHVATGTPGAATGVAGGVAAGAGRTGAQLANERPALDGWSTCLLSAIDATWRTWDASLPDSAAAFRRAATAERYYTAGPPGHSPASAHQNVLRAPSASPRPSLVRPVAQGRSAR